MLENVINSHEESRKIKTTSEQLTALNAKKTSYSEYNTLL